MAYSPYNKIKAVYDAKVNWGKATTDEERKKQNDIATAARERLKAYGYSDIANQVSADGADAAAVKKIMDNWATKVDTVTGNYKTGVDNPAYNQAITSASNKNDTYFDTVKSDHANVNSKYDSVFNYANSDITQTDEYKSAFKNIMPSYTLAAMQGRDNEVASGAASNSGNIDSFAAANAMRQQAALTAKGQQLAHQAGVDAVNARVQNAQNILSNLGIYNSSVYSAMDNSINNDRAIANDIFNNEQTALNNDVARKSEIASVSGYTPDEWVASNNPYMNDDGTIKDKYKDIDFSVVMANAKAAGNTEAYNAAAQARYYKIMGNYGAYGQYDDGNYIVPGSQRTAEYDLTQQQIASAENIASGENGTKLALADKEAASAINQIKTAAEYSTTGSNGTITKDSSATYQNGVKVGDKNGKPILTLDKAVEMYKSGNTNDQVTYSLSYYGYVSNSGDTTAPETDYQASLNDLYGNSSKTVKDYIRNRLEPLITENSITETELKENLIANSKEYDLEIEDIKAICTALGVDSKWVDDYKNSGLFGWGSGVKER